MASLKPLDTTLLFESVSGSGALVSVEDHNVEGGLGSALAREVLEAGLAPRFRSVGIADTFTESAASPVELRDKYGVGADDIVGAAHELCSAKSSAGSHA